MNKRGAKIKEILVWYKFRPNLEIWTSKHKIKNNSYMLKLTDETWYGGYLFNTGYFFYFRIKKISIHVKITWFRPRI